MEHQISASSSVQKSDDKGRLDALLDSTLKSMKAAAERLQLDADVADRLRTHPRMDSNWRILLQQKKIRLDAIPDELRMHCQALPSGLLDVPPQEQGCVALYVHTVNDFSRPACVRPIFHQQDWDALAARYLAAAQVCRNLLHEAPLPSPENKEVLQQAADYIENWISFQRQHTARPYIVGERSNRKRGFDDNVRARTRALAEITQRIFGAPLNRVVGSIATVALNSTKEITSQDVINWWREGALISRLPS